MPTIKGVGNCGTTLLKIVTNFTAFWQCSSGFDIYLFDKAKSG